MPGQSPLRHGTGEGVGYHRRARRAVESRRLPFLVGREPGRPGGVPADRHFAQYEGSARSTEVFGEVLVSREMLGGILERIGRLRLAPG